MLVERLLHSVEAGGLHQVDPGLRNEPLRLRCRTYDEMGVPCRIPHSEIGEDSSHVAEERVALCSYRVELERIVSELKSISKLVPIVRDGRAVVQCEPEHVE